MRNAIVSLSHSFFPRTLALLMAVAFLPGVAQAVQPPRKGELARYRMDGTYRRRVDFARKMHNDRFSPALVQRKLRQLRRSPAPITPWASLPSEGSPKVLALMIDFSDYPHVNDSSMFDDKLWGDGNAAEKPLESLRNFYTRSSYGKLNLTGTALGWYRAQGARSTYDWDEAKLIEEAINYYDQQGHDFTQYDNNNDGQIDYFLVFWSGPDTGWGSFWWGWMSSYFYDSSYRVDGKSLGGFSWQWESNPVGVEFSPDTAIHETGHALGLPDYYDYDYLEGPPGGVGALDIMDYFGDHNCFSKWMLGWITPTVVASAADANTLLLQPSGTAPDAVLVMPQATLAQPFGEYFMVQNRARVGNDAIAFWPTDGLLIWHVDARLNPQQTNFLYDNSYTSHKLLRLMEADGLEEIEAETDWGDAGDFYTPGSEFGPFTVPNSSNYAGKRTYVGAGSITAEGTAFRAWITAGQIADLLIKKGSEDASAFAIDNVHQEMPSGDQVEAQNIDRGGTGTYQVRIENDSGSAHSFLVKAVENAEANWTVVYRKEDGTQVTGEIRGTAGYTTGVIPGRGSETLTVEMTPSTTAIGDRTKVSTIAAYMDSQETVPSDVVQAATTLNALRQPDLLIKRQGEADLNYAIDDTYQETPAGDQVESQNVPPATAATYQVKVQNDGNVPQAFVLKAAETAETGWTVTYRVGSSDVSGAMRGTNGYQTASLAPGTSIAMTVVMTPASAVSGGTSKATTISAFLDAADATARDAVQAATTVDIVDQGDLLIKGAAEAGTAYAANDVYQTIPSDTQVKRLPTYSGEAAAYDVQIQNDGNAPDRTMVLKAVESSEAGWTVAYKVGATDITLAVHSPGGYTTAPLARGGSEAVTVELAPGPAVLGGGTKSATLRLYQSADAAQPLDAVQAVATMRTTTQPDLLVLAEGEPDTAWGLDDVYQATPQGDQVETSRVDPNADVKCRVMIQNDGKAPRTFLLRATESAEAGWTVEYKVGAASIDQITAPGGYVTGQLPVGGFEMVTIGMTPSRAVVGNTSKTATLKVYLDGADATVRDAVQVVVTANVVRRIDFLLKAGTEPEDAFGGDDDCQETPAGVQVEEQTVGLAEPAVYNVRLQNDGNTNSEDPTLKAEETNEAGWTVTYRVGQTDITQQVRGAAGYTVRGLTPGASTDLVVEVQPGTTVQRGTAKSVVLRTALVGLESTARDAVRLATRAVNRAPGAVELVSPAAGAQVTLTPTFTVKASDPDNDQVRFVIEFLKGDVRVVREIALTDSGTDATYTVSSDQALAAGEWTWRAKAIDSQEAETDWSAGRTFVANRAPSVPELLAPEDNTVVSPCMQFRLKSTDPDGDPVGFIIEIAREGTTIQHPVALVNSGTEASYTLPEDGELAAGEWTWRVRAVDGHGGEAAWSAVRTFRVPASEPALAQTGGLSAFGLPFIGGASPQALGLGTARVAVWDPATQRYLKDAQVTEISSGQGAWVKSTGPLSLQFAGRVPAGPAAVSLKRGWNLISSPFLAPLEWDLRTLRVRRGGEEQNLAGAVAAGWLSDHALVWQPNPGDPNTGRYVLVYDAWVLPGVLNRIEPWRAYWVKAAVDCELLLPPPGQIGRGARAGRAPSDGWSVRIQALSRLGAGEVLVGATRSGRALSFGVPPAPPTGADPLAMTIAGSQGAASVDVRASTAARQVWDVVVDVTAEPGRAAGEPADVTLSWPDLRGLPKDVSLTLVDVATGTRRYLRTTAGYTFRAEEGSRRFRLVADARSAAALTVSGLAVEAVRSDSRLVRFTLSRPAAVDLELLSPAGGTVGVVARGRAADAGMNQVVWSGSVARGLYLLRATATAEDGATVQTLIPVVMVR